MSVERWGPDILRRTWKQRLWWEVWIALLIFAWVTGAFGAPAIAGFVLVMLMPSAIALLWRGFFGLKTAARFRAWTSIFLALFLLGGVTRVVIAAPLVAEWLTEMGVGVDEDILEVTFLVISATAASGVMALLLGRPAAMDKLAHPDGTLARFANNPVMLRLSRELTWLLALISVALIPAALRASWVPNVIASIVIPITVLLFREDRDKWLKSRRTTPQIPDHVTPGSMQLPVGKKDKNRRVGTAKAKSGSATSDNGSVFPILGESCGGLILTLLLSLVLLLCGIGLLVVLVTQMTAQLNGYQRIESGAAGLVWLAVADAASQVMRRITARTQLRREEFERSHPEIHIGRRRSGGRTNGKHPR